MQRHIPNRNVPRPAPLYVVPLAEVQFRDEQARQALRSQSQGLVLQHNDLVQQQQVIAQQQQGLTVQYNTLLAKDHETRSLRDELYRLQQLCGHQQQQLNVAHSSIARLSDELKASTEQTVYMLDEKDQIASSLEDAIVAQRSTIQQLAGRTDALEVENRQLRFDCAFHEDSVLDLLSDVEAKAGFIDELKSLATQQAVTIRLLEKDAARHASSLSGLNPDMDPEYSAAPSTSRGRTMTSVEAPIAPIGTAALREKTMGSGNVI